jgi:hypothetical protein
VKTPVRVILRPSGGWSHDLRGRGPTAKHSIVLYVGFLTGRLRLAAILASGLPVLLSGPAVSLGIIVGQRFRGRLMFLSEPLVHKGYLILALGCRTEGFRRPVVGGP